MLWKVARRLALLAVLATAVLVSEVTAQCVCPEECTCDLVEGDMDCSGRGLQAIPEGVDCTWPTITRLQLQQNEISHVPGYAFSYMQQLQRLYLFDNVIETIDRNAFFNLTQLQYLYLDSNRLTDLHDELFFPVRSLYSLLLYSNRLSYLPVNIFSPLRSLFRLALHRNLLTVLDARSFNGLVSLEELYLSDNQIIGLSNAPFTFLNDLKALFLSNNSLTWLTRFDFIGVNRLEVLELNDNKISIIEDDTFLLHPDIKRLFINNNLITRVNRLTFAGILNLETLHLLSNRITSVSEGAFFRNRALSEIVLSDNLLEVLHPDILAGLQSLQRLFVDRNRLTYLVNNNFRHVPLLLVLVLNRNNLSCIESDTFNGVSSLIFLDLGRNFLSYLPENLFQYTPNLLYLLLNSNNLGAVDTPVFRNLNQLIQLSLQYNAITYVTEGALDGTDTLFYLQWNEELDFARDNRLRCDCSSRWLYQYIRERSRPLVSTIYCGGPPLLSGREMVTLEDTDFGCENFSDTSLRIDAGPTCENHVVNRGDCLRLTCTSTPGGRTAWTRVGGKPMAKATHTCRSFSTCVTEAGERELVIADASEEDTGIYICTATLMNVTTVVACKISLGEPPVVLSWPDDQYLGWPGDTAVFRVRVSGQPHPSVEWYHGTTRGTTVKIEEDRRHVISVSGSLVVMETKLEDEGMYMAIISNGAGTETVAAYLEFFFTSPCREECQNGGTCFQSHYCYCQPNFLGRHCEIYIGPPTEAPPPDCGSTDGAGYYDYGSGCDGDVLDCEEENGSGCFGSGNNHGPGNNDGSENNDGSGSDIIFDNTTIRQEMDEDEDNLREKRGNGDDVIDDDVMDDDVINVSPWELEGVRFQAALWETTAEERLISSELRLSRELRALEREMEDTMAQQAFALRRRKEAVLQQQRKQRRREKMTFHERETRNDQYFRDLERVVQEMIREQKRELGVFPEEGQRSEVKGQRVEHQNRDWRKMLVELGLALEWNADSRSIEKREDNTPVIKGLKLLPADNFNLKHTIKPSDKDIHTD